MVPACDRQTDGQTDGSPMPKSRSSATKMKRPKIWNLITGERQHSSSHNHATALPLNRCCFLKTSNFEPSEESPRRRRVSVTCDLVRPRFFSSLPNYSTKQKLAEIVSCEQKNMAPCWQTAHCTGKKKTTKMLLDGCGIQLQQLTALRHVQSTLMV